MMTSYRFLQQGSVLIITLLLLMMLTVMAVTQISFNSTQNHVATNTTDAQIALQTAEGALNQATNNLLAGTYPTSSFLSNSNGLYVLNASAAPLWTTINWTSSSAVIMGFQGGSNSQAAFFIELLPSIVKAGQNSSITTQVYRITARAVGASGNSPVILQSTVQIQ